MVENGGRSHVYTIGRGMRLLYARYMHTAPQTRNPRLWHLKNHVTLLSPTGHNSGIKDENPTAAFRDNFCASDHFLTRDFFAAFLNNCLRAIVLVIV